MAKSYPWQRMAKSYQGYKGYKGYTSALVHTKGCQKDRQKVPSGEKATRGGGRSGEKNIFFKKNTNLKWVGRQKAKDGKKYQRVRRGSLQQQTPAPALPPPKCLFRPALAPTGTLLAAVRFFGILGFANSRHFGTIYFIPPNFIFFR